MEENEKTSPSNQANTANLQIVIACAGGTNIKKERKKSNSGSSVI